MRRAAEDVQYIRRAVAERDVRWRVLPSSPGVPSLQPRAPIWLSAHGKPEVDRACCARRPHTIVQDLGWLQPSQQLYEISARRSSARDLDAVIEGNTARENGALPRGTRRRCWWLGVGRCLRGRDASTQLRRIRPGRHLWRIAAVRRTAPERAIGRRFGARRASLGERTQTARRNGLTLHVGVSRRRGRSSAASEPDRLRGPGGFSVLNIVVDLRGRKAVLIVMQPPDGVPYRVSRASSSRPAELHCSYRFDATMGRPLSTSLGDAANQPGKYRPTTVSHRARRALHAG
jgi:hypothetical protein